MPTPTLQTSSIRLSQILQVTFSHQSRDVLRRINLDGLETPDISHWDEMTAKIVTPLISQIWQYGMVRSQQRIDRLLQGRNVWNNADMRSHTVTMDSVFGKGVMWSEASGTKFQGEGFGVAKAPARNPRPTTVVLGPQQWNVYQPTVALAVDQATMKFCRATNETATKNLRQAIEDLRTLLKKGLKKGDAVAFIARKVQKIFADPYRAWSIATTECLTGDSVIYGGRIRAVYRRFYRGTMVQVVTKRGQQLTGSINHPVLTQRGWVSLGDLTKQDSLVCDFSRVKSGFIASNKDVEAPPTSLAEIYDSLSDVGIFQRVPTLPIDFHGDGVNGYVDVLDTGGELRYGWLASRDQLIQNGFLSSTYEVLSPSSLVSQSYIPTLRGMIGSGYRFDIGSNFYPSSLKYGINLVPRYPQTNQSSFDFASADPAYVESDDVLFYGGRQRSVSGSRLADVPNLLGLSVTSYGYPGLCDYQTDSGRVASKVITDGKETLPGLVQFDGLKSLRFIEDWHGYVYNLETTDGYYNANGYYTRNSSRAMHAGALMAAKLHPDVDKKEWLASSDACKSCEKLNGKQVKLDKPFIVLGDGPYDIIQHPPLHTH